MSKITMSIPEEIKKNIEELAELNSYAAPAPWVQGKHSVADWAGNHICGDFGVNGENNKKLIIAMRNALAPLIAVFTAAMDSNVTIEISADGVNHE